MVKLITYTKKKGIQKPFSDRVYDLVVIFIMGFLLLVVAYPLYFIIIASISDPRMVSTGQVLLIPKQLNFNGYAEVLNYSPIWTGYRNTILYTISFTALSTSISLLSGYALSRKNFVGRNFFMAYITFTMFFSGGLIPTYILMRNLGLYGKPIIIVLLNSVNVFNIIVSRTFFMSTIPEELYEAAVIDGCTHVKFFYLIALPVSQALIAVLVLFAAVWQWNSWFNAMIYLTREQHMPLQMVLRDLLESASAMAMMSESASMEGDLAASIFLVESMRYAVIIVSILPIMCVYPFIQRYFVKGVMVGSIKG